MSVFPIQHTLCALHSLAFLKSILSLSLSIPLTLLRTSHASRIFTLVSHNSCCFCFYSFLRWCVRWRHSSSSSGSANNNINDNRFSAYAKINLTVAISRIREYELDSRTVRFIPKKLQFRWNTSIFQTILCIVYRFCYLQTFYRWCELKFVACFGIFFPPGFSRESQNHDDDDVRGIFF